MMSSSLDATALPLPPRREQRSLSSELRDLALRIGDEPISLGQLGACLKGRGWYLLLLLLMIPFLTPIPMPLLSTLMGTVATLIGLRMTVGAEPRIPDRLAGKELPARFFPMVLRGSAWILDRLERLLRPRWIRMRTPLLRRAGGLIITISGVMLLLPLPIPFSNFLPAATILLLSAAALVRDGLCFGAGCVMFLLSLVFFGALPLGGVMIFDWLCGLMS